MSYSKDFIKKTAAPTQIYEVLSGFTEDFKSILSNLPKTKQNAFFKVMGNSPFLARWVSRESESALQVLQADCQSLPLSPEALLNLKDLSEIFSWEEITLRQNLLKAKYQQLFRITLLDMGFGVEFPIIGRQLSQLAEYILKISLAWWFYHLKIKYGSPKKSHIDIKDIDFSVIGMGKLGGAELNFSSDIDLIYFYESDEGHLFFEDKNDTKTTIVTPHGFFCKLAEKLSVFLSRNSGNGFLYRVDLELRPEGKSGTLANSLEAMEHYYETFGANWEKQAFIKAECSAGSEPLFQKLLNILKPFIYPKSTDFTLLKYIQEMKQRVENLAQNSFAEGYHLKLGPGGIRELEFFAQSLQLLYGGKFPQLQTSNTLKALEVLEKLKLISKHSGQQLKEAYLFLRTLENRLQQVEEQQTHRLIKDDEEMQKMARRMNYLQDSPKEAAQQLELDLEKYRQVVSTHFNELLKQAIES